MTCLFAALKQDLRVLPEPRRKGAQKIKGEITDYISGLSIFLKPSNLGKRIKQLIIYFFPSKSKLSCFAKISIPSFSVRGLYPRVLLALSIINPVFSGLFAVCVKACESTFFNFEASRLKNDAVSTAIS